MCYVLTPFQTYNSRAARCVFMTLRFAKCFAKTSQYFVLINIFDPIFGLRDIYNAKMVQWSSSIRTLRFSFFTIQERVDHPRKWYKHVSHVYVRYNVHILPNYPINGGHLECLSPDPLAQRRFWEILCFMSDIDLEKTAFCIFCSMLMLLGYCTLTVRCRSVKYIHKQPFFQCCSM